MAFQLIPFLIQLVIGVGIQALGYLLMPKPKPTRSEEVTEMEGPTAEGGRPIPVVFGERDVVSVNCIYWGDKETVTRKVKA